MHRFFCQRTLFITSFSWLKTSSLSWRKKCISSFCPSLCGNPYFKVLPFPSLILIEIPVCISSMNKVNTIQHNAKSSFFLSVAVLLLLRSENGEPFKMWKRSPKIEKTFQIRKWCEVDGTGCSGCLVEWLFRHGGIAIKSRKGKGVWAQSSQGTAHIPHLHNLLDHIPQQGASATPFNTWLL